MNLLRKGKWVATIESDVQGFHLNALYSPWRTWPDLVERWLEDKNHPETLKTFINTVLGETFDDQGERIEIHALANRLEKYDAQVPTGVGLLTAAVDIQSDRIEVSVWGWGAGEQAWLIDTDQIFKDPGQDPAWADLNITLQRKYKTKNGAEIGIRAVGIDTGHQTEIVYRWVKSQRNNTIFALKGSSESGRPLLSRPYYQKKHAINTHMVGTDTAKDMIFSRLRMEEVGPGYIHIPEWVDREFLEQLTSEKAVRKYVNGRPVRRYIKTRPRNEQLDLLVYALAALQGLGSNILPQLEKLAQKVAEKTLEDQEEKKEEKVPVKDTALRRAMTRKRQRLLNRKDMFTLGSGWDI